MKNVIQKSLLFQNWPDICFLICVICLQHAIWVLFLKQNVAYCVLSFLLVCVILKCYMLMFLSYLWIFQNHMWLCVIISLQTLELVQLDFPLGYWTWVIKYKANYYSWKISKKVLILTKLVTQFLSLSASLGAFMKKVTKSPFSFLQQLS